MLKYDYVHKFLRRNFLAYGGIVASYPYHFVLISVATFLVLAVGFFRLSVSSEVEYLYVPTNSKALEQRNAVEKLFPPVKESLDVLRMTRLGPSGVLILEPKDGGSIFRESIFRSARRIDDAMKNITVRWKENVYKYEDLCLPTADEECFYNRIFDLEDKMKDIIRKRTCFRYPIHSEEGSFSSSIYAFWLGGVTVDENSCIQDAKAIRLLYYLSDATQAKKEIALKWEEAFLQETARPLADHVRVYRGISSMLDRDGSKFTKLILPVFYVALPIMFIFAVGSCMTSDWITSKPWIGVAAFVSPLVATVGAFGLCLLCGMEYPEFNISIPFLMLAIGLDDSFVLLSAWRRTDSKNSVQQRMRETYAEAAVSITVTSITNLLSFLVGITTPYRVHKIFFVYAALSVVFCYISEITFFGGVLALSGYREARSLHALFFIPVKKRRNGKAVENNHTPCYLEDSRNAKELVTFYRDKLGKLLSTSWAKTFVITFYLFYLAGGIYGILFLKVGLEVRVVFPPTSYAYQFVQKNFEHFSDYPHVVQVIIHKKLDYSNPLVQKDVEEILNKFATSQKMAGRDIDASWLHSYLSSVNDVRLWYSYNKFNISDPVDFMTALKEIFLRLLPFRPYSKDLLFNENRTEIIASRFLLISRNVLDGYEEADLISELWDVADTCKYPVYVHSHRFVVQSLSSRVEESCFRTIIASAFLAMAVFVVTIPNLLCIILVGIAVASIELCVMGYMSLWNVGLDIVSSTGLIITTGLAIDYLAHISYAYIVSPKEDPNDKMRDALHSSGHPVFQGCFSTILLVCTFPAADAYGFVILFKIMLLLMLFAGFNSLILLPVCLASCEAVLRLIKPDKRADERTLKTIPESTCLMNSSYSSGGASENSRNCKGMNSTGKTRDLEL